MSKIPTPTLTGTITPEQYQELSKLTWGLPLDTVIDAGVRGYMSEMSTEAAAAAIERLRGVRRPTHYCHWCGMPLRGRYCDECGEQF